MPKPFKIETLFAWIVIHADGEDGIPAISQDGRLMPLVGSNRDIIYGFRDSVVSSLQPGMRAEFRQFHKMEVLEKIHSPRVGSC